MDADVTASNRYVPLPAFDAWIDLAVNSPLWDEYATRLEAHRSSASAEARSLGVRRSMLAAALNTGAIEGLHHAGRRLTVTVIEHALDWQERVRNVEGADAEAHVAAGLESLDMALDVATEQMPKLTEAWVRQLHAVACAPQQLVTVHTSVGENLVQQEQQFEKGTYKRWPNHVTLSDGSMHYYCPVDSTGMEMARLVGELNTDAFLAAHPVLQAAFAHHGLAYIHPFQDGNGRVARALASVYLLRAASIPLLVYEDQQAEYYAALSAADGGQRAELVRFVQDRGLDLMALATDLLAVPDATSDTARVQLPPDHIGSRSVEAAQRLQALVQAEMRSAVDAIEVADGITVSSERMGTTLGTRDEAGRRTVSDRFPSAVIAVDRFGIRSGRWFAIYASEGDGEPFELSIAVNGGDVALEMRVSDVYPEVRTIAVQRVRALVRRVVHDLIAEVQAELDRY
ncbi:Fic family protein [soil metagenome]